MNRDTDCFIELCAMLMFALISVGAVSSANAENTQTRGQQTDAVSKAEDAQEEDRYINKLYGLAITAAADLAITIKVNGVPFTPKAAGNLEALSIPIQREVVPGKNVIEVVVGTAVVSPEETLESVSVSLPDNNSLDISLQLDKVAEPKPGMYVTYTENLEAIAWQPHIQDGKVKLPQKLSLEFTAPADHPVPAWFNAEQRSVSDIEGALLAAYRDIVEALKTGDAGKIGRMSVIAYQDSANAYPIGGDAKERQDSDVAEIKDIISDPQMSIPDLLEPLTCKAYAEGRLFECFAPDGEEPVRILFPGEEPIYFIFRYSVIDNKLRVVR